MTADDALLAQVRRFAAIVVRAELNGLAFQHLALCHRRAWLHLHRVDYAHLDDRMQRGLALHDGFRPRDRSVAGLIGLTPDRIDWAGHRVYEAKGGSGAADAVSRQGTFYALMLWAAQGVPWTAAAHILPAKRDRAIRIDSTLVEDMVAGANALVELRARSTPPAAARMPFCTACSYRYLCGHD